MNTFYPQSELPKLLKEEHLALFNKVAAEFQYIVLGLDIDNLDISEYGKRYMKTHQRHLQNTICKCTYILGYALLDTNKPLNEFVFIDYGGGVGLLSLMAKMMGIGQVLYNDIYNVSCVDAAAILTASGYEADAYIHGSIEEVDEYLRENGITVDSITSDNVIEHVYDINDFLQKVSSLPHQADYSVVMVTSANEKNPLVKKRHFDMHKRWELQDRERKWGHNERDENRSFLNIRKEIIKKYAPSLTDVEVDKLSVGTRGLMIDDIHDQVDLYVRTGSMSHKPNHPTNTCDPYTGNWQEQLHNTDYLKDEMQKYGFKTSVLPGYYVGLSHNKMVQTIKSSTVIVLNGIISRVSSDYGLTMAPFFNLYAKR